MPLSVVKSRFYFRESYVIREIRENLARSPRKLRRVRYLHCHARKDKLQIYKEESGLHRIEIEVNCTVHDVYNIPTNT